MQTIRRRSLPNKHILRMYTAKHITAQYSCLLEHLVLLSFKAVLRSGELWGPLPPPL